MEDLLGNGLISVLCGRRLSTPCLLCPGVASDGDEARFEALRLRPNPSVSQPRRLPSSIAVHRKKSWEGVAHMEAVEGPSGISTEITILSFHGERSRRIYGIDSVRIEFDMNSMVCVRDGG
jgi:hypothetical protein